MCTNSSRTSPSRADESYVDHVVPRHCADELGKEFKLPDISSRWLTEVFQIWNDKFDVVEVSQPTADFQTGRDDMHVPPVKSADPDSEVAKKGVALTPIAGLSPAQRHSQISSEQQGICSSSVDSSVWDESLAQAEVVSSCNAVHGHLNDYERGINREGYGQKEVGART